MRDLFLKQVSFLYKMDIVINDTVFNFQKILDRFNLRLTSLSSLVLPVFGNEYQLI